MSAPCVTPESYGPGELCGATTIPYTPSPGLAETGVDLFQLEAVVVALVIGSLVVWAIHERLERRSAEVVATRLLWDNEALVAENDRYQRAFTMLADPDLEIKTEYAVDFSGGTDVAASRVRRTVIVGSWSPVDGEDAS